MRRNALQGPVSRFLTQLQNAHQRTALCVRRAHDVLRMLQMVGAAASPDKDLTAAVDRLKAAVAGVLHTYARYVQLESHFVRARGQVARQAFVLAGRHYSSVHQAALLFARRTLHVAQILLNPRSGSLPARGSPVSLAARVPRDHLLAELAIEWVEAVHLTETAGAIPLWQEDSRPPTAAQAVPSTLSEKEKEQPPRRILPCPVELRGKDLAPRVLGQEALRVQPLAYRGLELLVQRYPDGATSSELIELAPSNDIITAIRHVYQEGRREDSHLWKRVLIPPSSGRQRTKGTGKPVWCLHYPPLPSPS